MSRYIDADAIPNIYTATHQELILALEDAPSIDIVRCRECKFREANKSIYRGAWYCSNHGDTVDLDDYCSYGERKEGE